MASRIFFTPPRKDFGYYRLNYEVFLLWRVQSLLVTALLSFFAFIVTSYSQGVRIHERIEIKPENNIKSHATTSSIILKRTLPVDSYVKGYSWGGYYFEVNGVSFGSTTPPTRFSEILLPGWYEFGQFPAGTVIVPVLSRFTSYSQGWPDVDLIQGPVTTETITFTINEENGRCEPEGYIGIEIDELLHHIEGTFSKDRIEIGEGATLNLHGVAEDGSDVAIDDNLEIMLSPSELLQLEDADRVEGSIYYYRWEKAKSGIRVIGKETFGDGEYAVGGTGVWCDYTDVGMYPWLYVQTRKGINHYTVRIVPDTVTYGKSGKVYVQAKDENDNDMVPPYSAILTMTIDYNGGGGGAMGSVQARPLIKGKAPVVQALAGESYGSGYGYLASPDGQKAAYIEGIPYDVAHDGGVEFVAEGDILKSKDIVNMTITANDQMYSSGYGTVSVISSSILVTVSPSTISPGDTADIIVQKKKYDGTIEDFPPDQKFEIGMLSGCMAGEILTSVGKETYFKDVLAPFKFVAADSVDSTNNKILIRAGVNVDNGGGGGSAGSIRNVSSIEIPDNLKMKKQELHANLKEMRPNLSVIDKKKPVKTASMNACNTNKFVYDRYGEGEVEISLLDHFDFRLERDTVAFTETARFFVQAKNVKDDSIKIDGNKLLKLMVTTNDTCGTFIDKKGDTLKTTPVVLESIPYRDAKDGQIRFAAVKKNPDSVLTCMIRVELQEDLTKKGDTSIVVDEQTLKIVMLTPYQVRPSIPTDNQAMVNLRIKPFEVRMTRGGKPVANHPFQLRTDYVRGSGGHDHGDTRDNVREDNDDNYGYFLFGQPEQRHRPLEDVTNADGKFAVTYSASIFGDTMRIYLKSRNNRLLKDSVSVVEKVAGLQLLGDGANYVKVGGTCNHHGPRTDTLYQNCRIPDNDHFGTARLVQIIQSVADSLVIKCPNYRLLVNDMSLPLGSKFEINGSWNINTDHQEHRLGTNADVGIYRNGYSINLASDTTRSNILRSIIRNVSGNFPGDERRTKNHFHIQ
ncbi:MAG: hypothetical protein ABSB78_13270 [Bacteroidota bacterium]